MDEAAISESMPESVGTGSAKAAGKRRWVDEDPEMNSDTDSDEVSM
jgi:hypothetical protein